MKKKPNRYSVKVLDVRSGDDLILMVDIGFDNLYKRVRARLKGVDTPNATPDGGIPSEEAKNVQQYVKQKISSRPAFADLHGITRRGWWLITLYVQISDTELYSINSMLKKEGHTFSS